jgi:hypothetical protein
MIDWNSSIPSHLSAKARYRGMNKPLRWVIIEDLRIHRVHLFITQEEMNKQPKYTIVYSSLSLNNRSSCTGGHVRLTFCHFP